MNKKKQIEYNKVMRVGKRSSKWYTGNKVTSGDVTITRFHKDGCVKDIRVVRVSLDDDSRMSQINRGK